VVSGASTGHARRLARESRQDRAFNTVNTVFLSICFLVVLYPLLYVVSNSFSSPEAVISGRVWLWPVQPSLEGYELVFESGEIWRGYANTIFYTFFGTMINVVLTVMLAYPLSRRDFAGRNAIMFMVTFTMMFSGGIIPTFLLVRSLGILNTRWAMLLPNAITVWNVIITRTYFQTNIPVELLESAELDGCSNTRFILAVVVPLSGAIVAVITLFYAVMHWNTFFSALIYLRDSKLYPLQIILRAILLENQIDYTIVTNIEQEEARQMIASLLKFSLIVVASVPVLVIYPFVQKYFVQGVLIGALKG
jgi:multiple sugar transport system permease protein/putative aldouronate transport system permease protein